MGAGHVPKSRIQLQTQRVQGMQAAHRNRGSLPLSDKARENEREDNTMTITKIAGLFLLTMFFLGLGYWIGYTERKYEDEHR